ncbi:MAG: PilZ domain-containing protein [Desulfobacterales bacterium]|nr:PilZ domain-containing protein [Desulfobacterales bacterium]
MDAQKVFVKPDNSVDIQCPRCFRSKTVRIGQLIPNKHLLKIRCVCNTVFTVALEFRKQYRKETRLNGCYRNLTEPDEIREKAAAQPEVLVHYGGGNERRTPANCTIANLSRGGVGIIVKVPHNIRAGHELYVEFALDNSVGSIIEKNVLVRVVNHDYVGCQFTDPDQFDATLGFHLL